ARVLTGFIAWVVIAVSHYRYRKAFDKQNYDKSKLKYKAELFAFGALFAGVLCVLILIGQDVDVKHRGDAYMNGHMSTYIGIHGFLAFFIHHKVRYKTKIVPLEKVNLRQDVDMDEIK